MTSSNPPEPSLSDLNSSTLGAKFPEVTLPDGSKVQTGTVGALIQNIRKYDSIILSSSSSRTTPGTTRATAITNTADEEEQLRTLEDSFKKSIPLLQKVGMFELFPPEEWVKSAGDGNGYVSPGRKRVGELVLSMRME